MAHGAPDDSNIIKVGDTYRLDDMAELAARLGSPVGYHRFGDVIWMETFEGGLGAWQVYESSTDMHVYLQSSHCLSAGVGAELLTGAASPEYAGIHGRSPFYTSTRIGLSVMYSCSGDGGLVSLELLYHEGTAYHMGTVRIQHASGDVHYANSAGVWTLIANLGRLDAAGVVWYPAKLIIDTALDMFVGLHFAGSYLDLSDQLLRTFASTDAPRSGAVIRLHAPDATAHSAYIDSAVFTVNEF